jgi:DNA repair protein RadC
MQMVSPKRYESLAEREDEALELAWFDDARNLLIVDELSSSHVNRVSVALRMIIERGIKLDARSIIIAHNHPSGNPEPSAQDFYFTRQLAKVLDVLDIQIQDHIILAREGSFSFREAGLL